VSGRRRAVLAPQFMEDLTYWARVDHRKALRILVMMEECLRDPFHGIGKPEPLRHGRHAWSRRIDPTNRLVYSVFEDRVEFEQARYHYAP